MSSINLYKLQKMLKESNIELIFAGAFSQGLVEELGQALKERLEKQNITKSQISCVFLTFVEQAQNIRNYLIAKENTNEYDMIKDSGIIAISRTERGYCINSGNIISQHDIEKLKSRLETIVSMDREEINKYYKKVMCQSMNQETGQAGLGLIQIARKAADPIEYYFEKLDDDYSYYNLTVRV